MNEEMNITTAQYRIDAVTGNNGSIQATINGVELQVPLVEGNKHYDEIMRQVDAGTLTIADAE